MRRRATYIAGAAGSSTAETFFLPLQSSGLEASFVLRVVQCTIGAMAPAGLGTAAHGIVFCSDARSARSAFRIFISSVLISARFLRERHVRNAALSTQSLKIRFRKDRVTLIEVLLTLPRLPGAVRGNWK